MHDLMQRIRCTLYCDKCDCYFFSKAPKCENYGQHLHSFKQKYALVVLSKCLCKWRTYLFNFVVFWVDWTNGYDHETLPVKVRSIRRLVLIVSGRMLLISWKLANLPVCAAVQSTRDCKVIVQPGTSCPAIAEIAARRGSFRVHRLT
jgi:hypothetical protein